MTLEDRVPPTGGSNDSIQPTIVSRTPFLSEIGYGEPPDPVAAGVFLEHLQADPKGVVERFMSMCRDRKPDESLAPHSGL